MPIVGHDWPCPVPSGRVSQRLMEKPPPEEEGTTAMAMTHRPLPVLLRICAAIDRLFIVEVGPFGAQLAEDARGAWLATGNKNRPADVEQYVELLAQHIEDPERREAFIQEARDCIKL